MTLTYSEQVDWDSQACPAQRDEIGDTDSQADLTPLGERYAGSRLDSNGIADVTKLDRLRATNVGSFLPIPQLVLVGDQLSSRSVLESLTGLAFSRCPSFCTRHATQISCLKSSLSTVSFSIVPRPDADEKLKRRLLSFNQVTSRIQTYNIAEILEEASKVMGVHAGSGSDDTSNFTEDILKIEVRGPEQVHVTVITVPGVFQIARPGLSNENGVQLVQNMVKRFTQDEMTKTIAAVSCYDYLAAPEILKLIADADPQGMRTLGALSMSDCAPDKAIQETVAELVQSGHGSLRLGYCVIKSSGPDENGPYASDRRLSAEHDFFAGAPWSAIRDCCGSESLKKRMRAVYQGVCKSNLTLIKWDINERLTDCEARLAAMGDARADERSQRRYLAKIASRMQDLTKSALAGHYAGESLLQDNPKLRLITHVRKLNEAFADLFRKRGHYQQFRIDSEDEYEFSFTNSKPHVEYDIDALDDILDIIDSEYCCEPLPSTMLDTIQEIYESSLGPELGTVSGTVLASAFQIMSQKWEKLATNHTSDIITYVHSFLYMLMGEVCNDDVVCDRLWADIRGELCQKYCSALQRTQFLLDIERNHPPMTFDHDFHETLQKKRQGWLVQNVRPITDTEESEKYVPPDYPGEYALNVDNGKETCEDILDTLETYYHLARKRFVDTLCQQVVYHDLLAGLDSPLKVLSLDRILQLSADQLEAIAGEDAETAKQRRALVTEIQSLEKALEVLRS